MTAGEWVFLLGAITIGTLTVSTVLLSASDWAAARRGETVERHLCINLFVEGVLIAVTVSFGFGYVYAPALASISLSTNEILDSTLYVVLAFGCAVAANLAIQWLIVRLFPKFVFLGKK